MSKIAFVFPGQGSQSVGMAKDLTNSKVFERFDAVTGRSISKLCTEGTDEELKQTVNSQPAILATSLALLEGINITPDYVAGHSLGEYAALYAAKVIELDELIKLVQKRAELMNNAPAGAMTAILGLKQDKIEELISECSSEGIICAANYNTQIQTVISGEAKAIAKANELAKPMGAKRVVPLAVSGGFHSPLMKPVAEEFSKYIYDTNINDAEIPVITNVDAMPTVDKAELSSKMIKQMYSSVYWQQSVSYMVEQGVNTIVEIGPGKVLAGMIKKIAPDVNVYNICDKESIKCKILEELPS